MSSAVQHKASALRSKAPPPPVSLQAHPVGETVAVVLSAAVLGVRANEPVIAVVSAERSGDDWLPCGLFSPSRHATLEEGLRAWVRTQTGVETGFVQQLCTLNEHVDAGTPVARKAPHVVCVSYLALVGPGQCSDKTRASWRSWYAYFPWEDWRHGKPECLNEIEQHLEAWAAEPEPPCASTWAPDRAQRLRVAFGGAGAAWDEEKVLERYELLCEAGIVGHAAEDAASATGMARRLPSLSHSHLGDQASVLARAISELRRSVKYRPVVFELMHDEFTLYELQKTVEAILGPHLHKQNFRRLVEGCGLVEPTGSYRLRTGGRPAQLYRFRRDVIYECAAPGVRLKPGRA